MLVHHLISEMYNSHYVPQFILKSFGNHFDLYDANEQRIEIGLTSKQAFVVKGLYSNEVENTFNKEFEQSFSLLIEELKKGNERADMAVQGYGWNAALA